MKPQVKAQVKSQSTQSRHHGHTKLHGAKIEDYCLIGDCETAALVSLSGSIDWLCWPTFSSSACFAALLGARDHGYWRITVTIGPGNRAVLTLDPRQSATAALADLLSELSAACHGHFRGTAFPDCPGHDHPALISAGADSVLLTCPETGNRIRSLTAATPDQ